MLRRRLSSIMFFRHIYRLDVCYWYLNDVVFKFLHACSVPYPFHLRCRSFLCRYLIIDKPDTNTVLLSRGLRNVPWVEIGLVWTELYIWGVLFEILSRRSKHCSVAGGSQCEELYAASSLLLLLLRNWFVFHRLSLIAQKWSARVTGSRHRRRCAEYLPEDRHVLVAKSEKWLWCSSAASKTMNRRLTAGHQ